MSTGSTLEERAAMFAQELQDCLDGVLPGPRQIISRSSDSSGRFIVQHAGDTPRARRMPLYIDDDHVADLSISIFLAMDSSGGYLKAVASNIVVRSVLDNTPLVRLDYRADMNIAPVAHWQIYAERGAFSHLLSCAHRVRRTVRRPHDLSSIHFPVGGERFRPCVEDVLQFLVVECGIDAKPGWKAAVDAGRATWRRRQLAAAVRDEQTEAARVLADEGWTVTPPAREIEHRPALDRW